MRKTEGEKIAQDLNERINEIEEKVVTGENASHSMLHENQEVDQLVSRFIWKE